MMMKIITKMKENMGQSGMKMRKMRMHGMEKMTRKKQMVTMMKYTPNSNIIK